MGRGLSALGADWHAARFIVQPLSHTSTRLVRTSGGFYLIYMSSECHAESFLRELAQEYVKVLHTLG